MNKNSNRIAFFMKFKHAISQVIALTQWICHILKASKWPISHSFLNNLDMDQMYKMGVGVFIKNYTCTFLTTSHESRFDPWPLLTTMTSTDGDLWPWSISLLCQTESCYLNSVDQKCGWNLSCRQTWNNVRENLKCYLVYV